MTQSSVLSRNYLRSPIRIFLLLGKFLIAFALLYTALTTGARKTFPNIYFEYGASSNFPLPNPGASMFPALLAGLIISIYALIWLPSLCCKLSGQHGREFCHDISQIIVLILGLVYAIQAMKKRQDPNFRQKAANVWQLAASSANQTEVACGIEKGYKCRGAFTDDCKLCPTGRERACVNTTRCVKCEHGDVNDSVSITVGCVDRVRGISRRIAKWVTAGISGMLAIIVVDIVGMCLVLKRTMAADNAQVTLNIVDEIDLDNDNDFDFD